MAVSEHRTILSLGCGTRPERELLASLQRSVEGQSGWLFRVEIEGVWASFEVPLDALRATAEILHNKPEFRAGLHYGEVTLTDDGDLLGNTLSVAKRLEQVAEAGRAYLSSELYALVSRETLHFAEFESPIAVQLKGLGENLAVPMAECIHDCERAFKFLDSYGAEDSALFFGRTGEVREIEQILHSNPWVVLFGQSGVGKSSVLGAGVLPLLSARDYSLHTFRCLEEPLELLRESFGEDIVAGLSSSPRRVLLFDQFEEFFLRVEASARKEFWRFFDSALKNQDLTELLWVFSIREDFLAEMGEAEDVVDGMLDHRLRLLPLSREAAKECILGPAERCGRWVEPSLVEHILNDLFDQGIDPPELQIVLDRLDAGREPNSPWLTLESYRQVGGFTEILVDYLYEVLEQTKSPSAAKKVLLALVSEAGTKKAGTPQDLCERSELPISRVEPILEALVRARLVRRLSEGAIYELSHEYLIEEIQAWADEADLAARYAGFALEAEVESWNRLGSLMDRSRLRLLNSQRARLQPTDTQRELLLRASVVHGSDPSFWKGDFDTAPLFLRLLDEVEDPVVQRRLIEELHPLTLSDPAWQRVLQAMLVYGNPELLNKLSAGERTVQLKRQMERRFFGKAKMTRVEAGPFWFGSDRQNKVQRKRALHRYQHERIDSESDKVEIDLPTYWIDRRLVTNAEYAEFLPAHRDRYPASESEHPVVSITLMEAQSYADWLGKKLPSEEQWEKAARGTDGRLYPWGNEFHPDFLNSGGDEFKQTTPVEKYQRGLSPFGCYDMAGNVWEWTSSAWASEGPFVVQKGGSTLCDWPQQQCSSRMDAFPDFVLRWTGFRLCTDSPPEWIEKL